MLNEMKSCTYSVSGTHCRSCELIIEKEVALLKGVKSVSASTKTGTVKIIYSADNKPDASQLNQLFKDSGYVFSTDTEISKSSIKTDPFFVLIISGLIIGIYYILGKIGIFGSVSVSSSSLPPVFFFFGLLAGFSTCAALVGGIVLSLTNRQSPVTVKPAILFNLGRLIFFSLFGALLGYFGSFFHLSITVGALVTILVSILMLTIGLQMLGVAGFESFQLALPKSLTGRLADESNFQGKFMPFVMGGLTFFLPCGFTLASQSLALASGSPITGALIMAFFALGTFVPLLLIAYGSVRSQNNPVISKYFSQVAGILIILYSLFSLNSQLGILNLPNISFSPAIKSRAAADDGLPQVVNGKQVLLMTASAAGYTPNSFRVKAGVPISWQITSSGNAGCAGTVIAPQLFPDRISLVPGSTVTKEFIASTPGTYRFSCSMGMVVGSIQVVN